MVRRTTARPTATTPLTTATTAILATRIPQARGAGVVDRVARSSRRSAKDLVARSVDRLYVVVSERVGRTICAPTRRRLRRPPSPCRVPRPLHRPLWMRVVVDSAVADSGRRLPASVVDLRRLLVSGRVHRSVATSRASLARPRTVRALPVSLHSSRRSAHR